MPRFYWGVLRRIWWYVDVTEGRAVCIFSVCRFDTSVAFQNVTRHNIPGEVLSQLLSIDTVDTEGYNTVFMVKCRFWTIVASLTKKACNFVESAVSLLLPLYIVLGAHSQPFKSNLLLYNRRISCPVRKMFYAPFIPLMLQVSITLPCFNPYRSNVE